MLSVQLESLFESVNTSARINKLLLAGEKRMALRTDLDFNILLCGAGVDHISASAGDSSFLILGVDSLSHYDDLLPN